MAHDYDLFVIGGGSGGVRAARVAAEQAGARVGLAESSRMGGTCVIRGCVPKKLMVFASEFREGFEQARAYGWELGHVPRFDWPTFRARMHAELDRLEGVYRRNLEASGVAIHDAHARVTGPHEVSLSTGETLSAGTILIATGGRPVRPDLTNADQGLVSDDMFLLDELPRRLLIVGGGYIACEFACMMRGMGVDVTVYHRGAQILRGFDDEARGLISEGMIARGIDLRLGSAVIEMRREEGGGFWTKSTAGIECSFDQVLFATGRRPNTGGMGLAEAGVALRRSGAVEVDALGRSSVPSIWAIGDVTERIQLTPVAIREGMAFVRSALMDEPTPPDHDLVASAIFTQPEMGAVGLTEEEACARDGGAGEGVEIYATSFRPMRTAFAGRPERALMKLVVAAASRRVLGCHIVGPQAGEMIQLAAIAIKMGATKEQFDATCAVHPTMAEELVTMRAPVRTF